MRILQESSWTRLRQSSFLILFTLGAIPCLSLEVFWSHILRDLSLRIAPWITSPPQYLIALTLLPIAWLPCTISGLAQPLLTTLCQTSKARLSQATKLCRTSQISSACLAGHLPIACGHTTRHPVYRFLGVGAFPAAACLSSLLGLVCPKQAWILTLSQGQLQLFSCASWWPWNVSISHPVPRGPWNVERESFDLDLAHLTP